MPAIQETDPVVFARDQNNELVIPLRLAAGLEAILILIRCRLLLWRDEWYLDRDAGMPWLETPDGAVTESAAILGQEFDSAKASRAVRGEILTIPGVASIPELRCAFDRAERRLAIDFIVRTRFGDSEPTTVTLAA